MKENKKYQGKDVGVAVLDTGIFPHIDFENRVVAFLDYVNGKSQPYDDNGHGTHVCGVVAGSGLASDGIYQGVAPKANLIAMKVLDRNGNGNKRQVIQALQWIRENRENYNIRIVNISVGTTQKEDGSHGELIEKVEQLWDEGFVVIVAAGNMGPQSGSVTAPGSSRKVITVGSSDMLTSHQRISGRGPTGNCICKPDIVAPGNGIISCGLGRDRRQYAVKSGTSMSTPLITGATAVLLEKYPCLSNLEVKCRLKECAIDMGYPHNLQGWGLFHIQKFLE